MIASNQISVDPAALGTALLSLVNGQSGGGTAAKAVSSTPTAQNMHGFGGLFATPGVRAPIVSAMGLPVSGLLARLPAIPNDEDSPLFGILTGQTGNTGSQPTGPCADFPVVGKLKLCRQYMPFGRRGISTEVIDLTRVGRRNDRSEMLDFQLMGGGPLVGGQQGKNVPSMFGNNSNILNNEIGSQLYKVGVGWVYETAGDIYTANHDSSVIDFYGLQMLIKTGYRDALGSQPCLAVDSMVRNFGSATIGQGTNGFALVQELVYEYRYVRNIAKHTGNRATWAFVMTESAFFEVTAVWPCSYYTNRCTTVAGAANSGNINNTDAVELGKMRDEMRGDMENYTGQFLWIDGIKVEVIIDDTTPETMTAGGKYTSDIYLLNLTLNGMPSTLIEYFDYDSANGPIKAGQQFLGDKTPILSVDGGRFLLIYKTPTNTCVQYSLQTEYRLIVRAPFLCARLQNVSYVPLLHTREFDPSSPNFYLNGGIQNTLGFAPPVYYGPTA